MIRKIVLTLRAQKNLITETAKFKKLETGGVLCGYYDKESLVIDTASGPGPNANHQIDEFEIDKEHMDEFLDGQYRESEGKNIYVGEWHTHPQRFPQPSPLDLRSIAERTIEWEHGRIIFVIIGFIEFEAAKLSSQIIAISFDLTGKSFWQIPLEFEVSS